MSLSVEEAFIKPVFAGLQGPMLLGKYVAAMILGAALEQTWVYFTSYPNDKLRMKLLVAFLLVTNLIIAFSHGAYIWISYIDNFGNWLIVGEFGWTMRIPVILNPICSIVAQLFFLDRAWNRSNLKAPLLALNRIKDLAFPVLVIVILLLTWGGSIAAAVVIFRGDLTSPTLTMLTELSAWSAACSDVLIFGVFFSRIFKMGAEAKGFRASTDTVLAYILRNAVMTSALTTVLAVCIAVATRAQGPNLLVAEFFVYLLPPTYLYSIAFTLNYRAKLRQITERGPTIAAPSHFKCSTCSGTYSHITSSPVRGGFKKGGRFPGGIAVTLDRSYEYDIEQPSKTPTSPGENTTFTSSSTPISPSFPSLPPSASASSAYTFPPSTPRSPQFPYPPPTADAVIATYPPAPSSPIFNHVPMDRVSQIV